MRIFTPTLTLLLAAVASAQSSNNQAATPYSSVTGSNDLGRPARFEIAITPSFGFVSSDGYLADQSGFGLDAQFHVSALFLKVGTKVYTDVRTYVFGIGAAIPINNGRLTLNFDISSISIDSGLEDQQYTLRAVYDYQFTSGLRLGFGISRLSNPYSSSDEETIAPTFGAGYKFGAKGPTLDLTYSSKDAILGSPDSSSSLNTSVKFTF